MFALEVCSAVATVVVAVAIAAVVVVMAIVSSSICTKKGRVAQNEKRGKPWPLIIDPGLCVFAFLIPINYRLIR